MAGRDLVVLSTRVDRADRDRLAEQAEAKGMSLAEYVRRILEREARGGVEIDQLTRLERKIDALMAVSTSSTGRGTGIWARLLAVFRRRQSKNELSRTVEIDSGRG